jgi:hypothetical protein
MNGAPELCWIPVHALLMSERLDQICREQGITRVDLLKMNIEGAEEIRA